MLVSFSEHTLSIVQLLTSTSNKENGVIPEISTRVLGSVGWACLLLAVLMVHLLLKEVGRAARLKMSQAFGCEVIYGSSLSVKVPTFLSHCDQVARQGSRSGAGN